MVLERSDSCKINPSVAVSNTGSTFRYSYILVKLNRVRKILLAVLGVVDMEIITPRLSDLIALL